MDDKPSRLASLRAPLLVMGAALAAMIFWDRLFVFLAVTGALPPPVRRGSSRIPSTSAS